jgi:hypothetical protein
MMDMYALPVELLDERELHNRFKAIDAAVAQAKENIARSAQPANAKPAVKLAVPARNQ